MAIASPRPAEFYTIADVMAMTGIKSRQTVYNKIAAGVLEAVKWDSSTFITAASFERAKASMTAFKSTAYRRS